MLTVKEESLQLVGDAIREKTGSSELLEFPNGMVEAINGIEAGGSVEVEPIVLTSDCNYACSGKLASEFIKMYGDKVSTEDITIAQYMFYMYENEIIPFDINISNSATNCALTACFYDCENLKELPRIRGAGEITGMREMFVECKNLREIPDDYFDDLNLSKWPTATSGYSYDARKIFFYCYSLRSIPLQFFINMNPNAVYSYSYFYYGFSNCCTLDELINLPLPYTATWASSAFLDTFVKCDRLKNLTFQTNEDGTPLEKQWKFQTISLTTYVGWADSVTFILDYNSGISADKEVTDDASYQALKNDPDWFTTKVEYSRYNHDSAVNTINSLPDTSAYLATAGGTNTIKFKGEAGSLTDGGAINTLTEEEIAVAAAKGWTVSLV